MVTPKIRRAYKIFHLAIVNDTIQIILILDVPKDTLTSINNNERNVDQISLSIHLFYAQRLG